MKTRTGFLIVYFLIGWAGTTLWASDPVKAKVRPESALELLLAGNRNYATGNAIRPDQTLSRRAELVKGQQPFAIVLTCADSRVAPEIYFDQGLGDIFVLRNAGNVLDDHIIGSIEYAVEHLGSSLIIVVGHAKCGAVSAAVAGGHAPGHLPSIVQSIQPAVAHTAKAPGDKVDNAVRANAQLVVNELTQCGPIISEAVAKKKLKIVAARYDLASGRVEVLAPLATEALAHKSDKPTAGDAHSTAHVASNAEPKHEKSHGH